MLRRRAAAACFLVAAAVVSGCSGRPEDSTPVQLRAPAAAYHPPELVPWGVNAISCAAHEIDWDNTGRHPRTAPGLPDIAYHGNRCASGWFSSSEGSAVAIVEPGAFLTPTECHHAATHPETPGVLHEEVGADLVEVLKPGTALCVVTDLGRVVRARVDDVDPPDHAPTFRGEATVWTPRPVD